jgi:hypothetical protein
MSEPTPTTPAVKAKPAQPEKTGPECAVCQRNGAMWLLIVGDKTPVRVHRPCGLNAQKTAPEGLNVKVVPSRALRDEWNRKKQVNDFWSNQLSGLTINEKSS